MTNVNVKNSGSWSAAKQIFVHDSGTWKTVKGIWVSQSGSWVKAFPAAPQTITYTTPGTYTYTVPNGIYLITASVYAGGGAGSGYTYENGVYYQPGTGGSGGYITNQTLTTTPGGTITIVVGAGGAAGSQSTNYAGNTYPINQQPGGSSSITVTSGSVSATGGNPGGSYGQSGSGGSPNGVSGGANGTGYGNPGNGIQAGSPGAVVFSWT